jgi:peroxiredoxin
MKQLFAVFISVASLSVQGQVKTVNKDSAGYKVTFQTPNYKSGLVYLTYYYGKNIDIQDSALLNEHGIAVFKKNKKLQPGIYAIVFPGTKRLVDFLVGDEQVISIKSDTSDLLNKTSVTGSKENIPFQQYQKFIASKGVELEKERKAYSASKTREDSMIHSKKYSELSKELQDYRERVIKNSPTSMLSALFSAMKQITVPIEHPKTREDSVANYQYYKKHYWDGITFMDDRIIRTPFFLPKLETYFRDVLVQAPDSIINAADYLLLFARNNEGMYKFMLNWLTDEYITPKYMGQDAIFVHLFEKYHSKGLTPWLTEKQQKTISDRAYMLMANLIGTKAADLTMTDSVGSPVSLYDLKSEYTVVVFWEPTCSHCQKEVPRLDSIYRAKWKAEGVKIFAVLTENEVPKWKEFIQKHDLKDWVHVYQSEEARKKETAAEQPNFKQLYDITQTPTLYLLDKDKHIIAKKLSIHQLDDVLQAKIKKESSKSGK